MNYMLLIYLAEQQPGETESVPDVTKNGCDGLAERLYESGHFVAGGILQPTSSATSLRVRNGHSVITDGPFAETREQLAGYMLLRAKDLDEVLSIAAQHPVAKFGTVEIRPLKEIPALGPAISR